MPDISMCTGGDCPMSDMCYRFLATPEPLMQTYFLDPPVKPSGRCDYYWEVDQIKNKSNELPR